MRRAAAVLSAFALLVGITSGTALPAAAGGAVGEGWEVQVTVADLQWTGSACADLDFTIDVTGETVTSWQMDADVRLQGASEPTWTIEDVEGTGPGSWQLTGLQMCPEDDPEGLYVVTGQVAVTAGGASSVGAFDTTFVISRMPCTIAVTRFVIDPAQTVIHGTVTLHSATLGDIPGELGDWFEIQVYRLGSSGEHILVSHSRIDPPGQFMGAAPVVFAPGTLIGASYQGAPWSLPCESSLVPIPEPPQPVATTTVLTGYAVIGAAATITGRVVAHAPAGDTPAVGMVWLETLGPTGWTMAGGSARLDAMGQFTILRAALPVGTTFRAYYAGNTELGVTCCLPSASIPQIAVAPPPVVVPVAPAPVVVPVAPAPVVVPAPAPVPIVKVRAVSGRSKLKVDVDPNLGKRYWTFQVQRKDRDGSWKTLRTYRTRGSAETRTLNLKKGTYRVRVKPRAGYGEAFSTEVYLRR